MEKSVYFEDFEEIYCSNIKWDDFDGKIFLITGATGMLASYLVYYLCFLKEYKGINIKIIIQGRNKKKAYKKFYEFWEKDYLEFREDNLIFPLKDVPRCDYLIHAASLASPQYYATMPIEVAEPNAIGTYNLLKYAVENECESFLYFSSVDIYGRIENVENISENDIGKVDPLDIHSCYSESKRMGETWCKLFAEEEGVRTVIARIGHTYGPTMNLNEDPRVFATFMRSLVNNEDIVVHSNGEAKRAFCYISDAIVAFFLLILRGKKGEAYNVCNTKEFYSINNLAEIILSLKENSSLQVIHKKRNTEDSYVENKDNKENKPATQKLEELGWNPQVTVKDGFGRILRFLEKDI